MGKVEQTSDGTDVISKLIENTTGELQKRSLHALERAPISRGIQYIHTLQEESGGFCLMEGVDATPLMTGYALLAMGHVGLEYEDPAPKGAINYLKSLQHNSGGIGYYLDSAPSLGPTAIVAQALKLLKAPRSHPLFQGCQRYIASKMKNGGWKETSSADASDKSKMEVALTSLCAGALSDAILSTERSVIMTTLLEARNHDGGWGWADGHDSDVDHTAMAITALALISKTEESVPQDVRVAINQGREFLLQCQHHDGGFSQRPGGHESSAIDASGLAVHALASITSSTDENLRRAAGFFLRTQNADGGWGDKPGSESDLDSTAFVIQALMSSGETIITINEAEAGIMNLEGKLKDLFAERITVIANERDEVAADLKSTERKLQIVEAAVAALVTILSIVIALPFIGG